MTRKKLDARSGRVTGNGRAVGALFNSIRGKGAGGLLEEGGERVRKEQCKQGSPAFLPNSEESRCERQTSNTWEGSRVSMFVLR